jgi:hypothetical protein
VQFGGSPVIDHVEQRRVVRATSNHWLCSHHRGIHASDPSAPRGTVNPVGQQQARVNGAAATAHIPAARPRGLSPTRPTSRAPEAACELSTSQQARRLPAEQNWWASGLRYRRTSNRASAAFAPRTGRCAGHTTSGLGLADSVGRRSATNREQRCAALGAVALPAGTTVRQGHLPRVGDGDLLAADASAMWGGFRCLWVSSARFNHGQAA